jgi:hypothetical protein
MTDSVCCSQESSSIKHCFDHGPQKSRWQVAISSFSSTGFLVTSKSKHMMDCCQPGTIKQERVITHHELCNRQIQAAKCHVTQQRHTCHSHLTSTGAPTWLWCLNSTQLNSTRHLTMQSHASLHDHILASVNAMSCQALHGAIIDIVPHEMKSYQSSMEPHSSSSSCSCLEVDDDVGNNWSPIRFDWI